MSKSAADQKRERGSSNVEGMLYVPMMLILIFGLIQFGLVIHASQKAHAVAAAAYNVARYEGSTASDGRRAAADLLDRYGMDLPADAVNVTKTATEVRASVKAKAPSLFPFHEGWTIDQEVSGPTERIIAR